MSAEIYRLMCVSMYKRIIIYTHRISMHEISSLCSYIAYSDIIPPIGYLRPSLWYRYLIEK